MGSDFEMDDFDRVIDLLGDGPIDTSDFVAPPPSIWAGISDDLGLGDDAAGRDETEQDGAEQDATDATHRSVGAAPAVISLADERTRRRGWGTPTALATLAACVALLVAVPIGLALRSSDNTVEVASATLDALDGGADVSRASVVQSGDDFSLEFTTERSAAGEEFLELWLLQFEGDELVDLVSLGRVNDSGVYDIPDGIDLDRFDVVDVSIELDDGNDDHSGNSVLRGELA